MPFRGFEAAGIVACFDEMPGGGAMFDIDAPRNAPAKSPVSYLDNVVWHSELFQYEVGLRTSVTINHSALATKTVRAGTTGFVTGGGGGTIGVYVDVLGDIRVTDILLANHSMGQVPTAMVALGGRMLPSGFVVQNTGSAARHVSAWTDAGGIYLRETAISGIADLPATTLTYEVMAFRTRAPDPAKPLFGGGPTSMQIAKGIIDGLRQYARQVGVGDSPVSINLGPTIDVANGALGSATGGITVNESGYSGGLAAPAYRNIGL